MKRRDFLKAVGASTGLVSIPGCTTQPKRSPAGAKVKKKSLNKQRAVIQAENAGGGEETVARFSGTVRVEERVRAVTAQVLKLTPDEIKLDDTFTADLGADSLACIELAAMLEEKFDVDMDDDAILSILFVDTVGKAIEFITEVCKEQGIDVEQ